MALVHYIGHLGEFEIIYPISELENFTSHCKLFTQSGKDFFKLVQPIANLDFLRTLIEGLPKIFKQNTLGIILTSYPEMTVGTKRIIVRYKQIT